ncbi:MAG TPA: hypothetical protein PLJ35_03040 [Anaerolineae bacterium]|nr:hypothetical protein [Anaerolineae bacterium]HOQ97777.1 hypothetical protein [Anaerolineae bacterium]HPL27227.1 hypothetical protein [Anaerolineae bacterium]
MADGRERAGESRLRPHGRSFIVRVWSEELGGHSEWRGKVQFVPSGEALYFRDWATLIAFIERCLEAPAARD